MIIKSMARKTASFGQLTNYMEDGANNRNLKHGVFYKNIYARQRAGITKEFRENSDNLKKRKNGNYLYHEVISITRSKDVSLDKQKEILHTLVSDYVELRAKNNLVYGRLHDDKKDNLHFHLMISSNEIGNNTRHRLDKKTYGNIQKQIEKHVLNNYPELAQKIIYNQNKQEKTRNKEYELKKRTGQKTTRDTVKDNLTTIFSSSCDKHELFTKLSENGFELYVRGNTPGVKKDGKKYRLKTLGLLDQFNGLSDVIESPERPKKTTQKATEKPTYTTDKVSTKINTKGKNTKNTTQRETKGEQKKQKNKTAWEEVLNAKSEEQDDWETAKRVAEEKAEFYYKQAEKKATRDKKYNPDNWEQQYREKGEKIRKVKEDINYSNEEKKKKEKNKINNENLKYLDELDKIAHENEKIKAKLKKNRQSKNNEKSKNKTR